MVNVTKASGSRLWHYLYKSTYDGSKWGEMYGSGNINGSVTRNGAPGLGRKEVKNVDSRLTYLGSRSAFSYLNLTMEPII